MELCYSPDIFQEKMNGLEYDRAYIDNEFIISNGNFDHHLYKLIISLKKVKAAGFKIDAEASFLPKIT